MECDQEMMLWLTAWMENPGETEKNPQFRIFLQQGTNRKDFVRLLGVYRRARKITLCHRIQNQKAWEKTMQKAKWMKRRKIIYRIGRVSVAAAMVILGVILWWPQKPMETNLLASKAGALKAVIRMDDGKEYELSDSTGMITARLSEVDICLDKDNQVRYVVKDSATMSRKMNTLIVPRGGFYSIVLSDGSRIKLNAESQLSYPLVFSGNERVVELKGEAYFEVAANVQHPFRVVCGNREVVVTGTKFNISAYSDEMYATLTEGIVTVNNGKRQQRLKPGEQAVVSDESIEVRQVETSLYTAWVEGKFVFDNARLEDIVKTLSRWYDVEFQFTDPRLKELTFTLSAPCDENLLFVVRLLEGVSSARFHSEGDRIGISGVY